MADTGVRAQKPPDDHSYNRLILWGSLEDRPLSRAEKNQTGGAEKN